jgi:uncharacterized phage protein (TIGR01671 family)
MVVKNDLLVIDYDLTQIMTQQIFFERGLAVERDVKYYDFEDVILMQSTGLRDKNGKEIFEGDIVTDGDVISDIKYHQTLGFYMIGKYGFSVPFGQGVDVEYFEEFAVHVSKTFEVVGNIYENSELFEVD